MIHGLLKAVRALRAAACLAAFAVSSPVTAQTFDRLDRCDDMAALVDAARSDAHSCRPPRTELGRAIAGRLKDRVELCFFDIPVGAVRSFECVQTRGYPAVECFRAISGDPVRAIESQYRGRYDQLISKYLLAASACAYSNGRASEAPASLTDFANFGWIAKSRFSIGVETGPRARDRGDGRGDGTVIHGFASTDPALPQAPAWMEYIVAQGGDCRSRNCFYPSEEDDVAEEFGGWRLTHVPMGDLTDRMNDEARAARAPVHIEAEAYDLERTGSEAQSLEDLNRVARDLAANASARDNIIRRWMRDGRRSLIEEDGFRPATGRELAAAGFTPAGLQTIADKRTPYARRAGSQPPSVELLVKDSGRGCFRSGAVIVALMGTGEGMMVMSMGFLGCRYEAQTYLDTATEAIRLEQD